MSDEIKPIDLAALECVSGGTTRSHGSSSGGDPVLNDISTIADQIKNLNTKTSGMSDTSMFLLCAIMMQRQNAGYYGGGGYGGYGSSVVYYSSGGRKCW